MDNETKSKKSYKRLWLWIIGVSALVIIGIALIPDSPSATPVQAGTSEARTLGQDAFLRLPNNSDPKQVICLAPNSDIYDQYNKALVAKDYQGVLELTNQGLFCVHNGSEVKVVDTSVALTRVRVVKGASEADSDKVGQAGWTASEWVVDR